MRTNLTGFDLKMIACLSMLIDHTACVLGLTGTSELFLRHLIGRLAFPLFAFLLVEGFLHTRNIRRYLSHLLLFALLSEIPYDLAIAGTGAFLPEWGRQNTLFTLSLGLLLLFCMKKAEELSYDNPSAHTMVFLIQIGLTLLFGLAADRLRLDYGLTGIACIAAMYYCRRSHTQAVLAGCVCLNLNFFSVPGAFFSLLPVSCYNGSRGKNLKYLFYLFYPVHLLLLGLIRTFLL